MYSNTLFFPGCSLRKLAPQLVSCVYTWLEDVGLCTGQFKGCCAMQLNLRGEHELYERELEAVFSYMTKKGVTALVAACPNCFYSLKSAAELLGYNLTLIALPTLLCQYGHSLNGKEQVSARSILLHDSCPDVEEYIFSDAVRSLLQDLPLCEKEQHEQGSFCCGAGGVFANLPLNEQLEQAGKRIQAADAQGVDALITSCASCSFALCAACGSHEPKIYHYLELAFGIRIDW